MGDDEKKQSDLSLEKLRIRAKLEDTHDEVVELKAEIRLLKKSLDDYMELAKQNDDVLRGSGLEKGVIERLRWLETTSTDKLESKDHAKWYIWVPFALLIAGDAIHLIFELFGKGIKHFFRGFILHW